MENQTIVDCILEPINATHGYCPECDSERLRPISLAARRNCIKPSAVMVTAEKAKARGPGTELKKLLARFGIVDDGDCGCGSRMILMNTNGPAWCRENIETIEGWMREAAEKRGLPFVGIAARMMIRRAIRRAEKKEAKEHNQSGE